MRGHAVCNRLYSLCCSHNSKICNVIKSCSTLYYMCMLNYCLEWDKCLTHLFHCGMSDTHGCTHTFTTCYITLDAMIETRLRQWNKKLSVAELSQNLATVATMYKEMRLICHSSLSCLRGDHQRLRSVT